MTGNYVAFLDASSRALALEPDNVHLQAVHARARRAAFGDGQPMQALAARLRRDDAQASGLLRAYVLADVDDCAGVLSALEGVPEALLIGMGGMVPPNDLARARCLHRLGDRNEAALAARRALALLDTVTPPRPVTGHVAVWRGHLKGLAGRRDDGLAEVVRGRALAAASGDAILAGEMDLWVLIALVDLEDFDRAEAVTREYMDRPFPRLSPGEVLGLSMWSPLMQARPMLRTELQQRLARQVAGFPQATRDAFGPDPARAGDAASR
jgi:hypothetical protein